MRRKSKFKEGDEVIVCKINDNFKRTKLHDTGIVVDYDEWIGTVYVNFGNYCSNIRAYNLELVENGKVLNMTNKKVIVTINYENPTVYEDYDAAKKYIEGELKITPSTEFEIWKVDQIAKIPSQVKYMSVR